MTKKYDFDLIVIGSGVAGVTSACLAKNFGLNVAIVENLAWGGSALNYRDLPFCAASTLSTLYSDSVFGARFGISSKTLRYNFPAVKKWLALSKKRSGANSKKALESYGIDCLKGIAHFLSPYELSVGKEIYTSKNFIIASGSTLNNGGIIGIESVKCLTPNTAFDLQKLPKSMIIIGGGATGCEFAEFYASLGTKVQILDLEPHLLPKEDVEAGAVLSKYLEEKFDVKILTETRAVTVFSEKTDLKVEVLRGETEKILKAESIFLATGADPALDLGLENAGVKYDKNGIKVDNFFKTSMKHIYAIGDCVGGESSSERASHEAKTAFENLFMKKKCTINYDIFPRVVKTNPEIIFLGKTEKECRKNNLKYEKVFVPISEISASNTSDFREGFIKLLVDPKKKTIIGATLMCKNADLMSAELSIAVKNEISVKEISKIPHVSTSFSELIRVACEKF